MHFTQEQLVCTETFLAMEGMLQESVAHALLKSVSEAQVDIATTRQASFWAEHLPEIQAQWALLASAGQVLLEANGVERALKTVGYDATAIFQAYTGGDHPWCLARPADVRDHRTPGDAPIDRQAVERRSRLQKLSRAFRT